MLENSSSLFFIVFELKKSYFIVDFGIKMGKEDSKIGEQQFLRYCGVFLYDGFCIVIFVWVVQ